MTVAENLMAFQDNSEQPTPLKQRCAKQCFAAQARSEDTGMASLEVGPRKRVVYLGREMTMSKVYIISVTPFMIGSAIALIIPTVVRLMGYGWSMFPVAVLLGLPAPLHKGGLFDIVLHSHVWVAWLFMVMLLVQMVTASYRQKSAWIRRTHRVVGKYVSPACLLWLLPTSMASLLMNPSYSGWVTFVAVFVTGFETVMIVLNFVLGWREAMKRDIAKHKDIMLIMTLWALNPGWDRFNSALLQLMTPRCYTDAVGLVLSAWLANLEMVLYLIYMAKRAGVWQEWYIRMNVAFFGLRGLALGLFVAAAWSWGLGTECFIFWR